MTHAPRITDESVLTRWIGMEITRMNQGLVMERKTLAFLLSESTPVSVTKGGEIYYFDVAVLRTLGSALPEDLHRQLRLPILFFLSPSVPDSCACADPVVLNALQVLGEISILRTMQGDRFWLSRPIAYAIMKKYPTAVQIMMGV